MGQVQLQLPLQHRHHLWSLSLLSLTSFTLTALFADTSCLTVAGTLYCSPSSSLWSSSHWHKNCCPHSHSWATPLTYQTWREPSITFQIESRILIRALKSPSVPYQIPDQPLLPLNPSMNTVLLPFLSAHSLTFIEHLLHAVNEDTEAVSEGVTVRGETHIKPIVLHLDFWNLKSSKIGRHFPLLGLKPALSWLQVTYSFSV